MFRASPRALCLLSFCFVSVFLFITVGISEIAVYRLTTDPELTWTWAVSAGDPEFYNVYVSENDAPYAFAGTTPLPSYSLTVKDQHTYILQIQGADSLGNGGFVSLPSAKYSVRLLSELPTTNELIVIGQVLLVGGRPAGRVHGAIKVGDNPMQKISTTFGGSYVVSFDSTSGFTAKAGDGVTVKFITNGYTVLRTVELSPSDVIGQQLLIDLQVSELDAPTVKAAKDRNGDWWMTVAVAGAPDLSITADISPLDATQLYPFALSSAGTGLYRGFFRIDGENAVEDSPRPVIINAKDGTGNRTEIQTDVMLQTLPAFDLALSEGINFVHIPLNIQFADNHPVSVQTVGDLYDLLGTEHVNFILTHLPSDGSTPNPWISYLGDVSRGTAADRHLEADTGMIVVMKRPKTLHLRGQGHGSNGVSQIQLWPGTNLIGVPLADEDIKRVSDLLRVEGAAGNVTSVMVADGDGFKIVVRGGDEGNVPIVGGQAFIVTAFRATVLPIEGVAWNNVASGSLSSAPLVVRSVDADGKTPILTVTGVAADVTRKRRVADVKLRVAIRNLSTGHTSYADATEQETGGYAYSIAFVDFQTRRAAQQGDPIEVTVETGSPFLKADPITHILTPEDVKRNRLDLPQLVVFEVPTETKLLPNYPNPFNPETWIPYQLAADATVTLTIYNVGGLAVRTIQVGHRPAAVYDTKARAVYWDGRNNFGESVASGLYFYTLTAGDFSETRKMLVLK